MKRLINYLPFIALFLLPLLFYPIVDTSSWISSSDIHAMLEFASSLLAITAGIMVLLHFFTTGRSFFLIISIGFVLIGAEEFVHAIFSYSSSWIEIPVNFKLAISTTWLSGQFVLVTSLFIALFFGERQIEEVKRGRYTIVFNSIGVVFASIITLLILNSTFLPKFVQLGTIGKETIELSLAFLFFVASVLYFRSYLKQPTQSPLFWSIIAFIIFRVLAHIFVFDSQTFYDAHWDAGHLFVLLSYFFPIFGVWGETIKIHKNSQLQVIELEKEMAEHKQAEVALKESEQEFRNLAESIPQIVWTTDTDGLNNYFNQQWVDYTGLTLEESYGHGWNIPFHADDQRRAFDIWQNAVNNNAEYSIEARLRCHDGTYHWWLVRGVPLFDENGKTLKWFGTCTDIEKNKIAENELRESEEKFRNLFNNSEVGMYRTRLDGSEILEFNEKYLKILGYTFEEIKGIPSKDMWVNKQERDKMVQQLKTEGQVTDLECDLLTKPGNVINCITSLRLYSSGILEGSILDITERKKAEEEIHNMNESLLLLNQRINEISEDERKNISREIHDQLGQSLTALKIDMNWLSGKMASNSEEGIKLKRILELLTSTTKDVQRISSELHPAMLEDIGLDATIEWYCKEFEKRMGIKCQLKLDETKSVDEKKGLSLYRVLQEALTNVARHANAKKANINLYLADDSVVMEVIDDGIGIKKEKINSYKSLGLIGMRERVRKYNGTLDITPASNKGTKIRISIPIN